MPHGGEGAQGPSSCRADLIAVTGSPESVPGFPGRLGLDGQCLFRLQAQREQRLLPRSLETRCWSGQGHSLSLGCPLSGLKPETSNLLGPLCGLNEPQQGSEVGPRAPQPGMGWEVGRLKRPGDDVSGHRCWWPQGLGWARGPLQRWLGGTCWEVTARLLRYN